MTENQRPRRSGKLCVLPQVIYKMEKNSKEDEVKGTSDGEGEWP